MGTQIGAVARRLRGGWVVAIATSACLAGSLPASASWSPATHAVTGRTSPTLAQLEGDIATSAAIKKAPNLSTTVPPLSSLGSDDGTVVPMPSSCYPSTSAPAPLPTSPAATCSWGDRRAHRTILVTGDSQAGMWLPALNAVGLALSWRVVFLAHPGCPPWDDPYPVYVDGAKWACSQFLNGVAHVAHTLRPSIILPIGLAGTWGGTASVPKYPTEVELLGAMRHTFASYGDPAGRIVLVTPIPNYAKWTSYTPETCLLTSSDLTKCEFPISKSESWAPLVWEAERALAKQRSARVVSVTPLFCAVRCDVVVKAGAQYHLVYLDSDHINRFYSAWIGTALERLLEPALR